MVDKGRRRLLGVHHLDQAHERGRVEEVQAEHSFGLGHVVGDRADVDARGVGRQQSGRGLVLGQAREHLPLQFEALGHGLDDERALGQRGDRVDGLDAREDGRALRLGDPFPGDQSRERVSQALEGGLDDSGVAVD